MRYIRQHRAFFTTYMTVCQVRPCRGGQKSDAPYNPNAPLRRVQFFLPCRHSYHATRQIAVLVTSIIVYGLAPIAFGPEQTTRIVDGPDGSPMTATFEEKSNFWIGASLLPAQALLGSCTCGPGAEV